MALTMAYWLFKSEPDNWSWDQQVAAGEKGTEWDHVRSYQARNNMIAMRKGELGFFYTSNEGKSIVGIVKVAAEAHPDSTDTEGKWSCVDVAAVMPMPKPVTLAQVKAEPKLQDMALVKLSRLSVQPVTPEEWALLCKMGGLKKAPK
jgi:predicted RNA-binding protein with PUA-like domain